MTESIEKNEFTIGCQLRYGVIINLTRFGTDWKGRRNEFAAVAQFLNKYIRLRYVRNQGVRFEAIKGFLSFYPRLLRCEVDGERVQAQPGGFYGGWITSDLAGPFKGGRGSGAW